MGWVYLDDRFPEHPKVIAAGDKAAWLYVCGLAYTNRGSGDGIIPKAVVPRLTSLPGVPALVKKLIDAGLWHEVGESNYQINDYEQWNAPAIARRSQARKAAEARWAKHGSDDAGAPDEHKQNASEGKAGAMPIPNPHPQSPSSSSASASEPPTQRTSARGESGSNGTPPPWMSDPLVERWCTAVTGNQRSAHRMQAWRIVDHCRKYLDEAVIDENIGRLAQLDAKPGSPKYLLTTLVGWAAERNIKIPPLEEERR